MARVSLLEKRPFQYFRCLAVGHTRERCPSVIDRSGWCFNCRSQDHKRNACRNKPSCPICEYRGLRHDYKPGGKGCVQVAPRSLQGRSLRSTPPTFRAAYVPGNKVHCEKVAKDRQDGIAERAGNQSAGSNVAKSPKVRRGDGIRTKLTQAAKTLKSAKEDDVPLVTDEHEGPEKVQEKETSATIASPAENRRLAASTSRIKSQDRLDPFLWETASEKSPGTANKQTSKNDSDMEVSGDKDTKERARRASSNDSTL